MLRKNTTIVLIFLLQSVLMVAQSSRFKDDETLHVWASSGLSMRSKPDAKAEKIATIPYGAKVVVLPNIGVKIPFEVEEFKGFVVKGYWLLVKYENTEGFVFDGFLSRLPAPNKGKDTIGLVGYFEKKLGKIGGRFAYHSLSNDNEIERITTSNEKVDESKSCGYYQKFKKGVIYAVGCKEALSNFNFEISNATLFEALFLIKRDINDNAKMIIDYDKKTKTISINWDIGDGCNEHYTIKQIGNKIIVNSVGGC